MFSGISLLWDRQFGFLKETLVAPVPRIQIMLGRTCGAATVALLQGVRLAGALSSHRLCARSPRPCWLPARSVPRDARHHR
jgi:ABC-type Na+ efflux pump permease subunit